MRQLMLEDVTLTKIVKLRMERPLDAVNMGL